MARLGLLWLAVVSFGCTPPTPLEGERPANLPDGGVTCRADGFLYVDMLCGYGWTTGCSEAGDGLCHRSCESDADCGSGWACRARCLFKGGDACGVESVMICQRE